MYNFYKYLCIKINVEIVLILHSRAAHVKANPNLILKLILCTIIVLTGTVEVYKYNI